MIDWKRNLFDSRKDSTKVRWTDGSMPGSVLFTASIHTNLVNTSILNDTSLAVSVLNTLNIIPT